MPPADSSTAFFKLSGKVLRLLADPLAMQAQLAETGLTQFDQGDQDVFRDEISTDEIIPARHCLHVDEALGRYALTGFHCQGVYPVSRDAIKNGGFQVLVAGHRYGKGSSRESAPLAEQYAGIRLIVARSFERIYRENAHNIGLHTSTDFGLLPRLLNGEQIEIEELMVGLDGLSKKIIRCGGLLASGAELEKLKVSNAPQFYEAASACMSYGHKILARAAGVQHVQPGQAIIVKPDWRFAYDLSTAMAANLLAQHHGSDIKLADPKSILLFQDHLALIDQAPLRDGISQIAAAQHLMKLQRQFATKHQLALHDGGDEKGSEGICHAIVTERYALPGQLICGTDSHSSHAGALGALAFGVGTTAMAHAFMAQQICVNVPPASRIRVRGQLRPGVQAKDLMLYVLSLPQLRQGQLVGHLVHWEGEALQTLSMDERCTLTNMGAEMGAFSAILTPDAQTQDYLAAQRKIHFSLNDDMRSDADCSWALDLDIDANAIDSMVAAPGDPGLGMPVHEAGFVKIDLAYGGSCTGGKWEDWRRYHEVVAWGLARGMRVAEHAHLYLQYGSADVQRRVHEAGWEQDFLAVGAQLIAPGCGACINMGPGASSSKEDVTVSAQNRNFPGRSGPGSIWLASPSTVAASALMGRLASFAQLQESEFV